MTTFHSHFNVKNAFHGVPFNLSGSRLSINIFFFWIFSFFFQSERGLFPNTEFVFDIELPIDFVPKNNDGEVDEFKLVPANKLVEQICDSDMKTTSCPVTLDFLIRKGIVNAETGNRTIVFYKFLINKMCK